MSAKYLFQQKKGLVGLVMFEMHFKRLQLVCQAL